MADELSETMILDDKAAKEPTAKQKRKTLDERVVLLERNFSLLHQASQRMMRRLERIDETLRFASEADASKLLREIRSRLHELADRFQIEVAKSTMVSEVSRVYPSLWPRIVAALDKPDRFWRSHEPTIEAWKERLKKIEPARLAREDE